jgi:hypothetical protein
MKFAQFAAPKSRKMAISHFFSCAVNERLPGRTAMRFACQSCGKAYNLPEEKIADKSNVKLKCRVCGAIVEVKKQGEVVAQLLADADNMRARTSEAPAPLGSLVPEDMLTSMSADDDGDDATHAIAVGDQILSDGGTGDEAASALLGHVKSALGQRGLAPLPPPAPTGFGPTPVPPPLDVPRAEPLPPFPRPEPPAPPAPTGFAVGAGSPPPPPLPSPSLSNGSNGAAARFPPLRAEGRDGDLMPLPDEPLPPLPIGSGGMGSAAMAGGGLSMSAAALPGGVLSSAAAGGMETGGFAAASIEMPHAPPASDDTTLKMLAALATGILIGFIIARLFF